MRGAIDQRRYDVAVAIPARSEAERIESALAALATQPRLGLRIGVHLLCNNCEDDTAGRARAVAAALGLDIRVREVSFAPGEAHAGTARREAMAWAASELDEAGAQVLCSTDADSRVAPDWLAAGLAALKGADAVAGAVAFDHREELLVTFPPLRRLEDRYATLQALLEHHHDPRDHDPWPRHVWSWGANLMVRAPAFRRAGGVPAVPLAEDRALVAALEAVDAKVRRTPEVKVFTSARLAGRAPGGLADLAAAYARGESIPCDAALESVGRVVRRARLRREVRHAFAAGEVEPALLRRLRLPRAAVDCALSAPFAGEAWRRIEAASPLLQRVRLPVAALPREIARAERLVSAAGAPGVPAGIAADAGGALWSAARRSR